jgi:hypothetical protein
MSDEKPWMRPPVYTHNMSDEELGAFSQDCQQRDLLNDRTDCGDDEDDAAVSTLASMPRKPADDYWEFTNLQEETKLIDPDKLGHPLAARRRRADGSWEYLEEYNYPFLEEARSILVLLPSHPEGIPLPREIPWPPRELDEADNARWHMLSEYPLPVGLRPVPVKDYCQDPSSRLNRDWKPPRPEFLKSPVTGVTQSDQSVVGQSRPSQ